MAIRFYVDTLSLAEVQADMAMCCVAAELAVAPERSPQYRSRNEGLSAASRPVNLIVGLLHHRQLLTIMGYAGLQLDRLSRLLGRRLIDTEAVEDDSRGDHCVVLISDVRFPHARAFLYYENLGSEPRLARIVLDRPALDVDACLGDAIRDMGDDEVAATLVLRGRRADDPDSIAPWLEDVLRSSDRPDPVDDRSSS